MLRKALLLGTVCNTAKPSFLCQQIKEATVYRKLSGVLSIYPLLTHTRIVLKNLIPGWCADSTAVQNIIIALCTKVQHHSWLPSTHSKSAMTSKVVLPRILQSFFLCKLCRLFPAASMDSLMMALIAH